MNSGTLIGLASSTNPFGGTSTATPATLNGGVLQLLGTTAAATSNLYSVVINGSGTLSVNATPTFTTTLSFATSTSHGAFSRSGAGDTLIVSPTTGSLNGMKWFSFTSTNAPAVTSGIIPPYMVIQATPGTSSNGDFGALSAAPT